jgi:hypothetical protein
MGETSIHLWDVTDPDEKRTFPVTVWSDVIPRIGDEVHYYVDYPRHMPDSITPEPGQPMRVTGTVAKVRIQYRMMQGWGTTSKIHTLVSVDLNQYKAEPFPHHDVLNPTPPR